MTERIMGFDIDGSEIEFCYVSVPLTINRTIINLVTKTEAHAGWGVTQPGLYDVWEIDDEEAGTYRPWAKWRVTETGELIALRIPKWDTPNPCKYLCRCPRCSYSKSLAQERNPKKEHR